MVYECSPDTRMAMKMAVCDRAKLPVTQLVAQRARASSDGARLQRARSSSWITALRKRHLS